MINNKAIISSDDVDLGVEGIGGEGESVPGLSPPLHALAGIDVHETGLAALGFEGACQHHGYAGLASTSLGRDDGHDP